MDDGAAPELLAFLTQMKGELCWFVRRGADRILTMEFGRPHLTINEPYPHDPAKSHAVNAAVCRRMVVPAGVWHLFVDEADWAVSTTYARCSRSDHDEREIDRALLQLEGQRLVDAVQADTWSWRFDFDLGGRLDLLPDESLRESRPDDEGLWTVFHESGNYITFPNGRIVRPAPR